MRSITLLATVAISGAVLVFDAASAGEWTQWRGPTRDGRVESLPSSLSGLQLDWSAELGPSYSSPLVDDDRVYVTESVEGKREAVVAFDRRSGREVWRTAWDGAMKVPFFAAANGSWIRATPALAGGRLYVAGMLDVLVCLDASTGDEIWRVDFKERMGTPKPAFGYVSSPLVYENLVMTQAGGAVVAVDASTGAAVWSAMKTEGGMSSGSAFSSPAAVIDGPNGQQLLVQTRSTLAGLNPNDGSVYWSTPVEAFRGMNILTPTARINGDALEVFTSSYGGRSTMFRIAGGTGDVQTVWDNKSQGYMSSPVVKGDRIVVHLKNQRVSAFDWNTGDTLWTSRPYSKYWSMLTDGNEVLALEERGELHRIDVDGDEINVLESKKVSESETWAHVGWDGDQLLVRRLDGIDVYSLK